MLAVQSVDFISNILNFISNKYISPIKLKEEILLISAEMNAAGETPFSRIQPKIVRRRWWWVAVVDGGDGVGGR